MLTLRESINQVFENQFNLNKINEEENDLSIEKKKANDEAINMVVKCFDEIDNIHKKSIHDFINMYHDGKILEKIYDMSTDIDELQSKTLKKLQISKNILDKSAIEKELKKRLDLLNKKIIPIAIYNVDQLSKSLVKNL